jgi:hypothetical protein
MAGFSDSPHECDVTAGQSIQEIDVESATRLECKVLLKIFISEALKCENFLA